eukprot:11330260-Prorocentrum_lima.AAC.1
MLKCSSSVLVRILWEFLSPSRAIAPPSVSGFPRRSTYAPASTFFDNLGEPLKSSLARPGAR